MVWNSSKPMGTDGGSNLMEIKLSEEQKIWETIHRYPHIDELHIRILCENYENTDLLRFFNQKKETKVVNNREKRQNMLMNGGI